MQVAVRRARINVVSDSANVRKSARCAHGLFSFFRGDFVMNAANKCLLTCFGRTPGTRHKSSSTTTPPDFPLPLIDVLHSVLIPVLRNWLVIGRPQSATHQRNKFFKLLSQRVVGCCRQLTTPSYSRHFHVWYECSPTFSCEDADPKDVGFG